APRRLVALGMLAALALALTGCGPHREAPSSAPTAPALPWQAVTLPALADGRITVRDVAACPGRWYAVGGYLTSPTTGTPGVWSSVDGTHWSGVPLRPISLYGRQNILSTVACAGDTVVAVGAAAGGAHGNPRTSTWHGTAAAGLDEAPSQFELFGGDNAGPVENLTAGPHGWLIGGGRKDANGLAGGAVWWSRDGALFPLVDGDPALESDATAARAVRAVTATATGFVAVGSTTPAAPAAGASPGSGLAPRHGSVWHSTDGLHWTRDGVPDSGVDTELQAVTAEAGGAASGPVPSASVPRNGEPGPLVAAGVMGTTFAVWRDDGSGWRAVARFGTIGGTALPTVSALASVAGRDFLVASGGADYGLWTARAGSDAWAATPLPADVAGGADRAVHLAGVGDHLLLSVEDGTSTRLWLAALD
ncbi:MAG TPA: hypothetical protein VHA75_00260, partial [Rugosimonospora sp.]|nr:hypothetical protein [Rugosimonospora sp.]